MVERLPTIPALDTDGPLGGDHVCPEPERSCAKPLQMIDSTVIRAHHQAAGVKGGLHDRVSAVLEVAFRPRSTFSSRHTGFP